MSSPTPLPRGLRPIFLQTLLIIVGGFWVYAPVFHGDWLWDDNLLITANPLMNDPEGLWKIWSQPAVLYDYYPITYTVQRIEWGLWGMDTTGYHLTNFVLHIISAFLVWRLFSKLGLRLAWWGGLLFAVHPVMVESVAWIAELKNTLSLPPFLLALCFWIDYEKNRKQGDYLVSLGLFLAAILCKTTVFVFPVLILLYTWWKRGRIDGSALKASLPFFLVAVVFVGIQIDHPHDVAAFFPGDPASRLALVGSSLAFYFAICFWPVGLAPIYPQWTIHPPSLWQFLPWPVLAGVIVWFWTKRQGWGRHALLGLGFFLITLGPFAGFIAAPTMMFTWVMDHFLYIPIIGLIGLVVAGMGWLDRRLSRSTRLGLIAVTALVTALLAMGSHAYAAMFSDSEALWTYALQRNPDSWIARANLGEALGQQGRIPEAIGQFTAASKINPDYVSAHYDLATALSLTGRLSEAIDQYETVLRLNPNYAQADYDLGNALIRAHRIPEATDRFEKALQLNPNLAAAHFALGNLLFDANKIPEAIDHYERSLQIDPNHAEVQYALGNALLKTNQLPEAMEHYALAARLDPQNVEALGNLGVILARMGRFPEAVEQFEAVLQIAPDNLEARNNLGSVFLVTGRFPEAIEQYQEVLRIKPDFVAAQKNLARAQAMAHAHGTTSPTP